ncbi:hypothetical protein BDI4_540015 [Burkholderia diffusa]|nr:hypothetical protein BDI4_540015 [Burkholderia diffusa]
MCRTGQRSMASCLCYAPGCDGITCRARWGLARGRDLLASSGRMAESGRLEQAACAAARQAARIRATGPFVCCRRLFLRASCWGGRKAGQNPMDCARPGSKHHILVDAIPPIRDVRGRPLRKLKVIYGDRGYDSDTHRQRLRDRGIRPVIARRRTEHGSGSGVSPRPSCTWT